MSLTPSQCVENANSDIKHRKYWYLKAVQYGNVGKSSEDFKNSAIDLALRSLADIYLDEKDYQGTYRIMVMVMFRMEKNNIPTKMVKDVLSMLEHKIKDVLSMLEHKIMLSN